MQDSSHGNVETNGAGKESWKISVVIFKAIKAHNAVGYDEGQLCGRSQLSSIGRRSTLVLLGSWILRDFIYFCPEFLYVIGNVCD